MRRRHFFHMLAGLFCLPWVKPERMRYSATWASTKIIGESLPIPPYESDYVPPDGTWFYGYYGDKRATYVYRRGKWILAQREV